LVLSVGRRELLKQGADPRRVNRVYRRAVYKLNSTTMLFD
jgi:hypothetical protein